MSAAIVPGSENSTSVAEVRATPITTGITDAHRVHVVGSFTMMYENIMVKTGASVLMMQVKETEADSRLQRYATRESTMDKDTGAIALALCLRLGSAVVVQLVGPMPMRPREAEISC
eukprot:scaffold5586_cov124-Isochrysis_galbana.AAC.17